MAAARGRTITTFGQAFMPMGLSGGVTGVPPVDLAIIDLTLRPRSMALTLEDRDTDLTLRERSITLTIRDR